MSEPFRTARRQVSTIEAVRVRITDADGISGVGEAVATPPVTGETVASIEAALCGPLAEAVTGLAACELAEAQRRMATALVGNYSAKAAVDVAMHRLLAARLGCELAPLLGAARAPVRTDVTVSVDEPARMAAAAVSRVAEGFGTIKLKVGIDPAADVARVRAVADAIGPAPAVRLDANQAWSAKQAVSMMDQLSGLSIELLEQPVPAADLAGMAYVTARTPVPVLADESVANAADLLRVAELHAADLVNIKLAKCGGIRPAMAVAAVAAAAGIPVLVGGMMATDCAVAAEVAFAAVLPEAVHDLDSAWWLADQRASAVRYENGSVREC